MQKTILTITLIMSMLLWALSGQQNAAKAGEKGESNSTASSGKMPFCGDENGDAMVNLIDILYVRDYLGNGGPPPVSMFDGNVDGRCIVNIADISQIIDYIYISLQPPTCADTSTCIYAIDANNIITVGCAPYAPYPGDDSVAIPVFLDNTDTLLAFSLGFSYTSGNIEITSIDTTGALLNGKSKVWFDTVDVSAKKVLVGASALSPTAYIAPQSGGLLFNLNARILSGPVDQNITLDSSFVPPGGDFMIVKTDFSLFRPTFEPCLIYGHIEVTNLDNSGIGSLRWAIDSANTSIGPDSIVFAVSGTVNLSGTALPALTDDYTIISGTSSPGGAHSIVIDGSSLAGNLSGLEINGNNCVVEGLTINHWDWACIRILGHYNSVTNCYLNVNSAGNNREAGDGFGIDLDGNYNTIGGGDFFNNKNVISMSSSSAAIWINSSKHNDIYNNYIGLTASGTKLGTFSREGDGIWIQSSDSNYVGDTTKFPNFICNTSRAIYFTGGIANGYGNEIANNVIGLGFNMFDTIPNTNGIITSDAICKHNIIGPQNIIAGTIGNGINIGPTASNEIDSNTIIGNTIAGNQGNGIFLNGNIMHTIIGGSGPDEGNYIYNNGSNGIYIYENSDSNQVIGNHIGGDIAHPNRFNGATGVMIDYDCDGNLVDSNFIAYNYNDGISVMINGRLNNITRNSIYKNGDIGIDLDDDGVTLNDIGDGDSGPNDLLNFPAVDSVRYDTSDSTFVIYGTAEADAKVEAFLSHPADDTLRLPDLSGYGEAYEYIGFTTADGTGDFSFKVAKEFPIFSEITFTATDVDGNTSEFSANTVLDQAPLIIVGYSPINLKVIDPAGDSIGKAEDGTPFNTIGDATYDEAPNDSVNVAYPLNGDYTIIVLPEIGAPPGAIYSIGIRIDGSLECIQVENANVPASGTADTIGYVVEESYHYENGDANGDETYNLLDILLLIDCIYGSGDVICPDPYLSGDANCDRVLNLIDILYLIDHVYGDPPGPAPCILE